MDFRPLTPEPSVSPQIAVDDLERIAAHGFRSVSCNRPDGEDPDPLDWQGLLKGRGWRAQPEMEG